MVTGSFPPQACGVGDYTARLIRALERHSIEACPVLSDTWTLRSMPVIIRRIAHLAPALVHIQYPTQGFGWHLTPHLLCTLAARYRVVATIHEFSAANRLRALSTAAFSLADAVIFTTASEMSAYVGAFPWAHRNAAVIPIASNLPPQPWRGLGHRTVVYFGLLRPGKGIEQFLTLASCARMRSLGCRFAIIGSVVKPFRAYAKHLQWEARALDIAVTTDLDPFAASRLLSEAAAAYLPFPDGATERRGSILALMANGVPVVTTRGPHTTDELVYAAHMTSDEAQALESIEQLLASPAAACLASRRSLDYAARRSWAGIGAHHNDVYNALLSDRHGAKLPLVKRS